MVGIVSYGGFVPRYRLDRKAIFEAMGWLNPASIGYAKGEKAVANFDEDSLTMATASAIDCLKGFNRNEVDAIFLASTTMPFKERSNAGILATALNLSEEIRCADFSNSLKAGTTALVSAVEGVQAKQARNILVCAADSRLGKMSTAQEMIFGDGSAAFLVGTKGVIAEFKEAYFLSYDFVDHYRGHLAEYDRSWEERWMRDEGLEKFIPSVIEGLLKKCNLKISDFAKVIYPCDYPSAHRRIAKKLSLKETQLQKTLINEIGNTGAAHSLVILASALEEAKAGEKILIVGFGNGCDALFLEVTEKINEFKAPRGISGYLKRRCELNSYEKYLVFRGLGQADLGLRGEEDIWTSWSLLWRNRKTILGLMGNRCKSCGTPHFPPQRICANPECGAIKNMEDYPFADKVGHIFSYTADALAASLDPPAIHGQIDFEGGGRYWFDFTGCDIKDLKVGLPVEMAFRRRYYDKYRDIHGYFWKVMLMIEGGVANGDGDKG